MIPEKQAKPEPTTKHTVVAESIYIGLQHYAQGASVELTASQAARLGAAVKPA